MQDGTVAAEAQEPDQSQTHAEGASSLPPSRQRDSQAAALEPLQEVSLYTVVLGDLVML